MEIKKQTAVNWLRKEIENDFIHNGGLSLNLIFDSLDKAKEIEKIQLIGAYFDGQNLMSDYDEFIDDDTDAKEYYERTYERTYEN
jgi:hypothetical protein